MSSTATAAAISLIPIGTSVVAKWPSTSNYYKAHIVDYTDDQNYVCQFLDGSIIAVSAKYVDLPEKFQRTAKKLSQIDNKQQLFDRSISFQSMFISFVWIIVFLSVQHWFHYHHPDRDRSSNYLLLQQYPNLVTQYLLIWFALQWILARYLPHMTDEQLIYVKESHPNIYYKHRSNALWSFLIMSAVMILLRHKIPLRELTKSYYLLGLFSLGIALMISFILLTTKFFPQSGTISTIDHEPTRRQHLATFDFHLFFSIRPGLLLWPTLNLLLLLTLIEYNHRISIRLALSIFLQTIYIVNVFFHETSMIRQALDICPPSSFDAMFTNLCWVPFTATLTSYYIGKSPRPVHSSLLLLSLVTFTFGFLFQYFAMRQRARSTGDDSVAIDKHQRLLVTGCWQICRNPQLLAEIFMVIGWSLPAGFRHWPPWLYTFYIIGMSIYKSHHFDHALQKNCPPEIYQSYASRVKYNLIPLIY